MRLNVQGMISTYKATSRDTNGQYALAEDSVPPYRGAQTHIHHREDEAFYILDGEFEIECDCEIFRAGPGTFVLLPKGPPHRFQNLSDKPGRILTIRSPGGVEVFFEHLSALAEGGPPEPQKLEELTERFGIELLPHGEDC